MKLGYCRVSTDIQNLDLQRDALNAASCETIYEEKASGKNAERVELENCLKALRSGDSLVVYRLDRLGRSLSDLIRIVTTLENRGVTFESLAEKIDTASAAGKLIFHVFGALAEFERNLIRERTTAGLKAARARGRKGGRSKKLSAKEVEMVRALVDAKKLTIKEIADQFKVSRNTIYRVAPVQK